MMLVFIKIGGSVVHVVILRPFILAKPSCRRYAAVLNRAKGQSANWGACCSLHAIQDWGKCTGIYSIQLCSKRCSGRQGNKARSVLICLCSKALLMNISSPSFDWWHTLCMKLHIISEGLLHMSTTALPIVKLLRVLWSMADNCIVLILFTVACHWSWNSSSRESAIYQKGCGSTVSTRSSKRLPCGHAGKNLNCVVPKISIRNPQRFAEISDKERV